MSKLQYATIFVCLFFGFATIAQNIAPEFSQEMWNAQWVKVPGTDGTDYGVYLFRKPLEIDRQPDSYSVYVSADNQYQLFVNGTLVSRGPSKGDQTHWNFEQVDLAPFLKSGKNTIAAKVWNIGKQRPEAQRSYRTGFILQGTTSETSGINTNASWKCIQDYSYSPIRINDYGPKSGKIILPGYYVAGPGEKVDMSKKHTFWETTSFDDSKWNNAQSISPGIPKNTVGLDAGNSLRLIPSHLPQIQAMPQRFKEVRIVGGVHVPSGFPEKKKSLQIPAKTTATLLLDQTFLTNAYPTLVFSGGKEGIITLTYAESLYKDKEHKGNRDEVKGKMILGRKDSILPNGAKSQRFTPLSYRTYRYVELKVETQNDPLIIDDISAMAVGYPFQMNAKLETPISEMDKMMEIGWRTARLCAMDTYMDCPYWERLQYIGDTRIQAMVSLYNSGDDRLVKNALNLMDYSRQPEGITLSRYPTINSQIIAPFSLWYIGMLKDYMMYGTDRGFVSKKLSGTRQILAYFEQFQTANGSLKNLPSWSFTDWVDDWQRGIPPFGKDGTSALLDLQLLRAYQNAQAVEKELGMPAFAEMYRLKIEQLSETIKNNYWDKSRKLFADTTDKDKFSQHTNALVILTGLISGTEATELGKSIVRDTTLTPASIYFKYYEHQALVKAGLGDDYLSWLDIWRDHMNFGLTTWAEDSNADTTRSDCHAWGSSPNIEFFRTILGIDSASPNFKTVKIEPHLGDIKTISGEMPHPNGKIEVNYRVANGHLNATLYLPSKTSGTFVWAGKSYPLNAGENNLSL